MDDELRKELTEIKGLLKRLVDIHENELGMANELMKRYGCVLEDQEPEDEDGDQG